METNAILPKEISTKKMSDFVQHVLDDLSASERVKMSYLGSQLGLYQAMAYAGPLTVGELARRTHSSLRLVKQWLERLAAAGYIAHEPDTDTYTLPAEHAIALTDPNSPFYIGGRFMSANGEKPSRLKALQEPVERPHQEENGLNGHLVDASSRFFSAEYVTSLFGSWLPAVEGLTDRLRRGITVADLGKGRHGASTLSLAEAFPASTFIGFDRYASSVERASLLAKERHIPNARFELATAEHVYAQQYDLITLIESLHQMGDLPDLLQECYEVLKPDGVVVAVEAKDRHRVGEELYQRLRSHNRQILVPEEVSRVEFGVDTNEKELRKAATAAGFTLFRKVAETVYDKVYELRP